MWESVAIWPPEIIAGNTDNSSTDNHDTKKAASLVCEALEREGLGGVGNVFPLETYVRYVRNNEKK